MHIQIDDIVSTVRAVDGEALLSPRVTQQIVTAVLRVVRDEEAHGRRVREENAIGGGDADAL